MTATESPTVHIFFVLDRSGSMQAIRSDVIGGFNTFVDQQQRETGECRMTLVQFDTDDPHEVVAEARPLAEIPALDESTFVPRGLTPLYDAMGHVIADATIRAEQRAAAGEAPEEIIFVTFTDGAENASCEYDRAKVFDLVKKREARGWTFVYMGANQDAYAESSMMGYAPSSSQAYRSDSRGTRMAFSSISSSMAARRRAIRTGETYDPQDFFEGEKPAEEDERTRSARKKKKLH